MAEGDDEGRKLWRQAIYTFNECLAVFRTQADHLAVAQKIVPRAYGPQIHGIVKGGYATLAQLFQPLVVPAPTEAKSAPDFLVDACAAGAGLKCVPVPFDDLAAALHRLYHAGTAPYLKVNMLPTLINKKLVQRLQSPRISWTLQDTNVLETAIAAVSNTFMRHGMLFEALRDCLSKLMANLRVNRAAETVLEAVARWLSHTQALMEESKAAQRSFEECRCYDGELTVPYIATACTVEVVPTSQCKPPCAGLTAAELRGLCPAALKEAKAEWKASLTGGTRPRETRPKRPPKPTVPQERRARNTRAAASPPRARLTALQRKRSRTARRAGGRSSGPVARASAPMPHARTVKPKPKQQAITVKRQLTQQGARTVKRQLTQQGARTVKRWVTRQDARTVKPKPKRQARSVKPKPVRQARTVKPETKQHAVSVERRPKRTAQQR